MYEEYGRCPYCGSDYVDEYEDGTAYCHACGTHFNASECCR